MPASCRRKLVASTISPSVLNRTCVEPSRTLIRLGAELQDIQQLIFPTINTSERRGVAQENPLYLWKLSRCEGGSGTNPGFYKRESERNKKREREEERVHSLTHERRGWRETEQLADSTTGQIGTGTTRRPHFRASYTKDRTVPPYCTSISYHGRLNDTQTLLTIFIVPDTKKNSSCYEHDPGGWAEPLNIVSGREEFRGGQTMIVYEFKKLYKEIQISTRRYGYYHIKLDSITATPASVGTTVAERLARSPPTKAIRVQFPAGSLRIFACGNRAGRCRWSAGFSRGSPVSPTLSFRRYYILTSVTLIGSQGHDVKSRPDLFTHQQASLPSPQSDAGEKLKTEDSEPAGHRLGTRKMLVVPRGRARTVIGSAFSPHEHDAQLLETDGTLAPCVDEEVLGSSPGTVHTRRTQQEPVTRVEPRETGCIAATHERAARHPSHSCCDVNSTTAFKWPMCKLAND
ncbi:hypothetical protein PR048_014796 [Dryococelus australis]|uniref:Uncharacterized protein n=1 Tax=Dryococelus australis TaxID=614101 RepID=A0ABQ9HF59_9NEOP|nr:hypothetical protein PR048_014796 [Dryococelus australis]